MSEKKEVEEYQSEEASSQAESVDASKSGTSETYDMKDFCPGIRIEAKDFDGKWYPAKVSDVDWTENEILVHFENWNTKFDEWIPMDSSRLRPIQKPVLQQKDPVKFSKGEEVMAVWSANQKYPGIIQAVLANDRYDVLFSDGFLKRLKGHKISKLQEGTIKPEVKTFVDIGTKEERRERKRKINVAELFHVNKRSKKKGLVNSKSQDIKTYPVCKSRTKNSLVKTSEENSEVTSMETKEIKQSEEKPLVPGVAVVNKTLIDNIPAAFEVKYLNGQTETWTKQLYQRSEGRTAGKLDIVILNPQGRKFRSRNEIMKYCEENGIIYSHEAFDFSAKGRPKSKPIVQTSALKNELNGGDEKEKTSLKKGGRKSQNEMFMGTPNFGVIPPQNEVLPQENTTPNKVFIGEYEVVIENGKFICPVKACAKHFRRENLLHMHMKHYHPEFSKYLDYTPSVTDLAYARTVGNLDAVETLPSGPRKIPGSDKQEKPVIKVETYRKTGDVTSESTKEIKKLKTNDNKVENRAHSVKPSSDIFSNSLTSAEESHEENSKGKINTACLPLGRASSNLNETETEVQENSEDLMVGNSSERVPKDGECLNVVSSVIKPSRHPRLHSRKKSNRYQGSFSEHLRKRRFLSQDRSRPHNRLGRHQQTQLPGKNFPLSQPLTTTVSPQSCVEDTNTNTPSQGHAMARYLKPHLNLSNEISGKNILLTNYKAFKKSASISKGSEMNTTYILEESKKIRRKTQIACRRSFLTGLINARKRKEKITRKRRKRRDRNQLRNFIESLDVDRTMRENKSGHVENTEKPDALQDETKNHSCDRSIVNINTPETCEKTQIPQPNKSLKIEIKRLNVESIKTNEEYSKKNFINVSLESSDVFRKAGDYGSKNVEKYSSKTRMSNDPVGDSLISTENIENSPPVTKTKSEINSKDLPKSFVLLENIFRKENFFEPKNVSQKGNEFDESIKSCSNSEIVPLQKSQRLGGKRKRNNESDGGKKSRRRPAKKVRFEKSVLEKWIDEGKAFDWSMHSPKNEEGVRREERQNKQRKFHLNEYFSENEMNHQKRLEGSSRDEKCIQNKKTCGLDQAEATEDSKSPIAVENDKVEKLRRNEIINCLCGIVEEDGLMIQCDICLCWQHGHCAGILREVNVPDKYTCAICKNPYRGRSSMKYLHDQEWLKEGSLPSLSFRSKRKDIIEQRKVILKRSHDLSGSITLLAQVIRSLRIKVNIAEKKDHPKLWLWAKKWTEKKPNRLKEESEIKEEKVEEQNLDLNSEVKKEGASPDAKHLPKAPEPEAPIDSAECRLNLLDHLIHYQSLIDARLSCIESLVAELESMQDDAVNDETPDRYPRTKATVQMILRDLNTMRKIATI